MGNYYSVPAQNCQMELDNKLGMCVLCKKVYCNIQYTTLSMSAANRKNLTADMRKYHVEELHNLYDIHHKLSGPSYQEERGQLCIYHT